MSRRHHFSKEFSDEAVRFTLTNGQPHRVITRDFREPFNADPLDCAQW